MVIRVTHDPLILRKWKLSLGTSPTVQCLKTSPSSGGALVQSQVRELGCRVWPKIKSPPKKKLGLEAFLLYPMCLPLLMRSMTIPMHHYFVLCLAFLTNSNLSGPIPRGITVYSTVVSYSFSLPFFFFSWRKIALQYFVGLCHTST